ncbi:MAG TPA: PLD nuclease N-terminal domain-containing protein [Kineosporiaceae bacterium]
MSYVVLLLISVGVTIYALVDCWRSTDDDVRGLPRPAWILLIILVGPLGVPAFGATAYLLFGRPPSNPRPGGVVAPDDDPEFLRSLDAARSSAAAEERRRREQRERKERDRQEKQQRKNDADGAGSGPEAAEGDGRSTA